jgi:hypothetical protein
MKKHIYGMALFVVIVGFFVFIQQYFNYSGRPDCTETGDSTCVSQTLPYTFSADDFAGYAADDVAVQIDYVEAGMRTQKVKTRLKLEWQGEGDPPNTVWVQLQFHNFDGSSAGWTSEPLRVSMPFKNGDKTVVMPVFGCDSCSNLSRNLYASAAIWTRSNAGQKLVYEINGMRSVLVQE